MKYLIGSQGKIELMRRGLTMRQVTVCEALMNYPEISDVAKSIGVADKTIKSHITSVMRALGMPKSGRRHYILLFLFPLMVIAPVEGELPGGKSN